MRATADSLPGLLAKELARCYLVSGDEPLQAGEAADLIRERARAANFTERQVFHIERGFDWSGVRHSARALSLFSARQVIELRMPSGKPERGAEALLELIEQGSPDILSIIVTGKLDQKAADAPWVRAVANRGVWIAVRGVERAALPAWLQTRAKRLGCSLESRAAAFIAERAEGNLLAAAQELTKLALLAEGAPVTLELATGAVADNAQYDIFDMASAASAGDASRALHVLDTLHAAGTEATLLLWALTREIRGLWQAHENRRRHSSERGSRWNLAASPTPAAMQRTTSAQLAQLLCECARVDRVIKGFEYGADRWEALRALTAALAGALPTQMLERRVA